ncbi:MAG: hypothetical protein KAX55_07080 [Propionivibrio sp.]|nr:hypothetical protein [Propionivibrio sp.]
MPNPKKEKGAVPFENTRPCESHTSQFSATASNPVFPQPNSIREAALRALVTGPIRQSGFQHSWRLAAYVRFLKDDGWEIISREVAENGRTVAEYTLDLHDDATREAAARYRVRKGGA